MDNFKVPIDKIKFRQTNSYWNLLMLNDPWSVGFVSHLIELKNFTSKQEWLEFYFEMGRYRQKKISALDFQTQKILNDEQLIRTNKNLIYKLPKNIIEINKLNGRTEYELKQKGEILYQAVKNKINNISIEECFKAVVYRVIGETWNGIVLREKNTLGSLKTIYPKVNFVKTSGEFDYKYAVDYELFLGNSLICGIQIKPKSYTYNTPYLNKAKRTNLEKNKKYFQEFNAPVYDVFSTSKGSILNTGVLSTILEFLK